MKRKGGKGCQWMLLLWRRSVRLVLLHLMRVTFGDDLNKGLWGVLVKWCGRIRSRMWIWRMCQIDSELVVNLMSLPWLDLQMIPTLFMRGSPHLSNEIEERRRLKNGNKDQLDPYLNKRRANKSRASMYSPNE